MFSLFLIGLGSAIFFFEVADYTLIEHPESSLNQATSTITNTYALVDVDRIDAYGATIVIDEMQEGIKVELSYMSNLTEIEARTYTIITDCTVDDDALCHIFSQDKITTLVLNYNYSWNRFSLKDVIDLVITEAKDKKIINVFNLAIPKMTITVNSMNRPLINN